MRRVFIVSLLLSSCCLHCELSNKVFYDGDITNLDVNNVGVMFGLNCPYTVAPCTR